MMKPSHAQILGQKRKNETYIYRPLKDISYRRRNGGVTISSQT